MTGKSRSQQADWRDTLKEGAVIPACPLALTADRSFDERRQRALVRYYVAAGAGGLAVGVHTTQFAIHDPSVGLYEKVLRLASETLDQEKRNGFIKIAGLVGNTAQALREADLACSLGYHCGLLSLASWKEAPLNQILSHCAQVAQRIPLFGFYLQTAVGGRLLPYEFWSRFAEIDHVVAIKIAPFNRYHTLDVVRGIADSGRAEKIALYTGNDDNIVMDLLTEYRFSQSRCAPRLAIVGGLLGHWAAWTSSAVEILNRCKSVRGASTIPADLLALNAQVTDANAAFFDVAHGYAGCIAGIHEVLRRQGLLEGTWCLDRREGLSPGQCQEIDRVYRAYPNMNDDDFISKHLEEWLS